MWACVWQCEWVWHGVLYSCIVWQFSKWATEEVDKWDDYKKWVGQARPLNVSTHACTLNQPGLTLNPINAPYFLRWRTFQTPSMDFYPKETFPQSKMVTHIFKVVLLTGSQVFFYSDDPCSCVEWLAIPSFVGRRPDDSHDPCNCLELIFWVTTSDAKSESLCEFLLTHFPFPTCIELNCKTKRKISWQR